VGLSIQVDARKLSQALERMPELMARRGQAAFSRAGNDFTGGVIKRMGKYPNAPGGGLNIRSARLRDSIGFAVTGDSLGTLQLKVFSAGVPYANLQEYGGVVRPKTGKFLTIPTPANLTGAGVPRFPSARDFINQHKGETFWLRTEAGGRQNLLLMWKKPGLAQRRSLKLGNSKAAKETAVPMFRLVRSSTVRGRLGMRDTWNELSQDRMDKLSAAMRLAVRDALGGSGG
jgi:hypothetical protein